MLKMEKLLLERHFILLKRKNKMKIFFTIIAIFLIGFLGGAFADYFLYSHFQMKSSYPFQKVIEKKEIIIDSDKAVQDSIEKIRGAAVFLETKLKNGQLLSGSGVVATSDGLAVVSASLIPKAAVSTLLFIGEKNLKFQIIKRDLKNGLALLKIDGSDFKTCAFADSSEIRAGQTIFLFDLLGKGKELVNKGVIEFLGNNSSKSIIFKLNP